MSHRRLLRPLLVAAILALPIAGLTASPAAALSCGPVTLEEVLATGEIVFIGEQVDEVGEKQLFRVDEWIRGGDEGSIVMLKDPDWGGSYLDRGVRVFRGWQPDEGDIRTALCGNGWSTIEARAILDGPPTPMAGGAPAFVVSMSMIPGIVGAVLNDDAEVIHYAPGDDFLFGFANCPGDDVIAVVTTDTEDEWGDVPDDASWQIQIRRTADLAVERIYDIDTEPLSRRSLQIGIRDLECHSDDGTALTALAPGWQWDSLQGRDVVSGGTVIIVDDGAVRQIPIGWVRDVTRDATTGAVHVLHGEHGRELTTIDGAETTDRALPGTHKGWRVHVDNEAFEILTHDRELDPSNLHVPLVTHVLRGPFEELESTLLEVNTAWATLLTVLDTPDGRALLFHNVDQRVLLYLDEPQRLVGLGLSGGGHSFSIGSKHTLAGGVGVDSGVGRVSLDAVDPETGSDVEGGYDLGAQSIDGLLGARSVAAVFPTDEVNYEDPPTTTSTPAPDVQDPASLRLPRPNTEARVLVGVLVALVVVSLVALGLRRRDTA